MTEGEIVAKFGDLAFKAKGGLRVAKLPPAPAPEPLLKDAGGAAIEVTLIGDKLVRMNIQFTPSLVAATEAALVEGLKRPAMDQDSTFSRGQEKFIRRDLTWFGETSYVSYRRFTRPGDRRSNLMISVLPRQVDREKYDQVSVNQPAKADFYISQNGAFVKAARVDGKWVFQLKRAPFQIGGNHEFFKVALGVHPFGEFTLDLDPASTDRFSCLGGMRCGAVEEDMDYLIACDGRLGCDSISCVSAEYYKKAKPLFQYRSAFEFSAVLLDKGRVPMEAMEGVLHGFVSLTTEETREDGTHLTLTTPVELVFH
jgi:hypothetical protein